MLTPVVESLCLLYEAALGWPMTVGKAAALSDHERLLLALVYGSKPRQCLTCSKGVGATLDCAVCLTRIMLAVTIGEPVGRTQQ